ncbi:hypothetical protein PV05_04688 [Exophiala xenobiotica]|uniref:Peptidase S33 tripeptidyl aminopeptidase-like C-terminal domain-containing protein n=1 Tax=Exophiala xenobiotica TaxID=348802 RepID=A0A0D2EMR9_9EURO|nr:uncharacterized protein PV05_04688 [Exophiala xenobiotica]KIW55985.1 hypothetical protein PV05_04688 [Exophiala xenobiotica]
MDIKFSAADYVPQRARDRRKMAIWPKIVITSLIVGLCLHSIDKLIGGLLPERYRAERGFAEGKQPILLAQSPFRWSTIEPSNELQYHDCYDGLQCARLDVPMDYHASEVSPDRVALAIIRLPAKVSVSDPRYGGAILINPGGPGGSGVAKLLQHGSQMQHIVDSDKPVNQSTEEDDDRYFDIIGFDPRGVNHSTPILTCFPDSFARQTWNLQSLAEGLLGSSEGSLRTGWRRARAFSMGCSSRLDSGNGTTNFLEHVNTTPATADMVEIIERHGQWREREGQRAQDAYDLTHGRNPDPSHVIAQRTKWQKGHEPLLYWGFSYGTVLGSTFAAMYPERVSRMVLDGVVDAEDYYNGPWLGNLQDTDRILHNVMRYCSEAGPDNCRLWRPGGTQAVLAAYERLLQDIWDDPLSVVGDQRRGPEIITWTDVKMVVKDALYQPIILGPIMVELLQDIINGTGSVFAEYKQSGRTPSCRSEQCEIDGPYSEECVSPGWNELEATSAILCTDAQDIGSFTEDEFRGYWRTLQGQSKAMGDYWAQTRLGCASWQARAKWRFAGPVAAANTSHPILWVSNTLDTVTPLRNAKRMNERFPRSVLLQQDCEGHCSFAAPSLCTAKAVKKYFQTGKMPEPWTLCETDAKPFEAGRLLRQKMAALSTQDAQLLTALQQLAESQSSNRFL